MGDPAKWVRETLDAKKRIMGFGHRVYRAEDPRSRILKRTARELGSPQIEVAERLERRLSQSSKRRHPERPLRTNVEYYSALVLDVAEIPPPLAPCDVRVLPRCRLVGAHPRAEANGQASSGRRPAMSDPARAQPQLS
jgi:hypothetical protein